MTRTLADMTPQERDACRGMWCEFTIAGMPRRGVIDDLTAEVYVHIPGSIDYILDPKIVTLLPDLPRAWGADGEPVKGKWKEGSGTDGDVHVGSYWGYSGTTHRRFVHDWEAKL